jgi:uroporphyrinogen decarboxylase
MTTLDGSPFLAACRNQGARHTPIWLMRQAGRSLPEYRARRGNGSILEAIKNPQLAAELTMQPVRRYGVDAAVLFSDIVVPIHAIGFGMDVAPGTGPVADEPFRRRADLDRIRPFEPELDAPYVAETVKSLVAELDVPLIAFAGAPFTVGSYVIEGRPSRTYEHAKALMHTDPTTWHELLDRLAGHAVASISAQLSAGASAYQLFDSWTGTLSRADYEQFVQPHSARVFGELATRHPEAPAIHFGVGCDHLLEAMYAAQAGARSPVIGLDWRTPIDEARRRLGATTVVQGNLDPALVLAGWDVTKSATDAVLRANGGHPGHIFNLGHGVQPQMDPGLLARLVDYVHEVTGQ